MFSQNYRCWSLAEQSIAREQRFDFVRRAHGAIDAAEKSSDFLGASAISGRREEFSRKRAAKSPISNL